MKSISEVIIEYSSDVMHVAAIVCLTMLSGIAWAGDDRPSSNVEFNTPFTEQLRLIAAVDVVRPSADDTMNSTKTTNAIVKESWLTGADVHEYLGLGTLGAALATSLTAPESCRSNCSGQSPPKTGTHQTLGRITGALALATVATGLLFHWDDMHLFADGLSDPDTQHWLLAGAGALLLADAVRRAPAKEHSAQAEAGAAMMLIAVKIAW